MCIKSDLNHVVGLDIVEQEIKVDSILKQVLCRYVQSFRIDFTIEPETN